MQNFPERLNIYDFEREDGLEEILCKSDAQIVICSSPVYTFAGKLDSSAFGDSDDHSVALNILKGFMDDHNNFDLYPIFSIMVSTGWNGNTDIFVGDETWSARNTPVNKPFNLQHDPRKIIGHITGSLGVHGEDLSRLEIIDDASDSLPDKFHIFARSVIYKHYQSRDDSLQEETAKLIQEIQDGNKWYVSMEALFSNFDYGFVHPDGAQQIIARQESTAFLTKHLRQYGGSGEFRGSKLGRVLRNITFTGKGLTDNPANPESVIFSNNVVTDMFNGVLASEEETEDLLKIAKGNIFNVPDIAGEDIIMSDELKNRISDLESKLSEANRKLEEMGEKAINAKFEAKDSEIASLQDEIKSLRQDLEKSNSDIKERDKSLDQVTADKIKAEKKVADLEKEKAEAEAEAKCVERVSKLVDKGVDKTEADKLVKEFASLDDDQFDKFVEIQAALVLSKMHSEDDKDKKKKENKDAAADVLDDAEPDNDPAMASGDDGDNTSAETMKAIAEYIGGRIGVKVKEE